MDIGYSIAGLIVGLLVGLTGVGGGSLMAPILIVLFGFNPMVAVGTDLWFAALTKSVGGTIHRRFGSPDWQIIKRLAAASIPAAIATLIWLNFAYEGQLEAGALLNLLGGALLLSAIILPIKGTITRPMARLRATAGPRVETFQFIVTIVAGLLIGCLVALTSVGAGALVAVILMVIYPFRLETKSLVGTDIIHAVPLAFVAAIGHSWLGNVDWSLLLCLLAGSIPGIIAGSLLAGKVNDTVVRMALAVMLAISGIKLLTM
ncbi:MAG: sulfite exporter TauE/SafE family protein [Sphingomonadaceae bacterium]|nr:sulfite exporter TauE/SafE family protein [Sphingomonadaceae bacterium]